MAGPIHSYRDLLVWQKAVGVALIVLKLAERLKNVRSYVLADQMERGAVSIPSNLAESHGRRSRIEFRRHVAMANGSVRELETQLEILRRYRPNLNRLVERILEKTEEIGRMLNRLYRSLESRPPGPNAPTR